MGINIFWIIISSLSVLLLFVIAIYMTVEVLTSWDDDFGCFMSGTDTLFKKILRIAIIIVLITGAIVIIYFGIAKQFEIILKR